MQAIVRVLSCQKTHYIRKVINRGQVIKKATKKSSKVSIFERISEKGSGKTKKIAKNKRKYDIE